MHTEIHCKKILSFRKSLFLILTMLFMYFDSASAAVTPKEYCGALFIENKEEGYFSYKVLSSEGDNGYVVDIIRNFYPTKDTASSGENDELHILIGKDFVLNSLRLKIKRPIGEISVEVKAEEKTVSIDFIKNDYITHDKILIDGKVYPSSILCDLIADKDLAVGSYEFNVLYEDIFKIAKTKLEVVRKFDELVGGKPQKFFEVKLTSKDCSELDQKIIIDDTGKLVSRQYVHINILDKVVPSSDITRDIVLPKLEKTYIPTNAFILQPQKLVMLKVKGYSLRLLTEDLIVQDRDQSFTLENNNYDAIIEIGTKTSSAKNNPSESKEEIFKKYLGDSIYVETKDKEIQSLALETIGTATDTLSKITKISEWINKNIKADYNDTTFQSARDALRTKKGNCTEYSVLFCALARSLGIPTKGVFGLTYFMGNFGYHMWNEVYDNGKWIPVDVTTNQVGSLDAAHIRFSESDLGFMPLAFLNYKMYAGSCFSKFDILDYKGSKGISLAEISEPPRPNLTSYPEAVSPIISTADIVVQDPIRIAVTYFDISDLPDDYKLLNFGLKQVFIRNLMCLKKFSVIKHKSLRDEENCFSMTNAALSDVCDKAGADYLLIGKISKDVKSDNNLVLKASLFDKAKSEIVTSNEFKCEKKDFVKKSQDIIPTLATTLGYTPPPNELKLIKDYYITDFDNFVTYSFGAYMVSNMFENIAFLAAGPFWLRVSLRDDPNFSLAYKALADLAGSSYYYNMTIKLDPYDAECYWEKYMDLIGDEKKDRETYQEAKVLLEKALNIAPYYAMAHLSLGSRYSHNNEHDKALEETLKAKLLSPKSPIVYLNLGIIYRDKKMPKEAEAAYSEAIKLDSEYQDAYISLSRLYLANHDTTKAIEICDVGLKVYPEDAELLMNRATAYYRRNNFEQAASSAKRAVKCDPKIAGAHYMLGRIYRSIGRFDDAIKEFELEVENSPNEWSSYVQLGSLLGYEKKDYKKAVYYYNKGVELGATDGCSYSSLVRFAVFENIYIDKMIDWAKKGTVLPPAHDDHFEMLGWAYYKNGKYDEAIQTFEACIKKSGGTTCLLGYGLACLQKGDKQKAIGILKMAFGRDANLAQDPFYKSEEKAIASKPNMKEALDQFRQN